MNKAIAVICLALCAALFVGTVIETFKDGFTYTEKSLTAYAKVTEKHPPVNGIDLTSHQPIHLKPLLILKINDSVTIESSSYSLFQKMEIGDSVEVSFRKVKK